MFSQISDIFQTVSCSLTGHERKQYETDLEQVHGTLKNLLEGEVVPAGDTEWTEEREQIWRHMRDEVIKMRQEHQATVDENEELLRDKERLAAELQTATEKHRAGERDLYRIHQDRIRMEEQVRGWGHWKSRTWWCQICRPWRHHRFS